MNRVDAQRHLGEFVDVDVERAGDAVDRYRAHVPHVVDRVRRRDRNAHLPRLPNRFFKSSHSGYGRSTGAVAEPPRPLARARGAGAVRILRRTSPWRFAVTGATTLISALPGVARSGTHGQGPGAMEHGPPHR